MSKEQCFELGCGLVICFYNRFAKLIFRKQEHKIYFIIQQIDNHLRQIVDFVFLPFFIDFFFVVNQKKKNEFFFFSLEFSMDNQTSEKNYIHFSLAYGTKHSLNLFLFSFIFPLHFFPSYFPSNFLKIKHCEKFSNPKRNI